MIPCVKCGVYCTHVFDLSELLNGLGVVPSCVDAPIGHALLIKTLICDLSLFSRLNRDVSSDPMLGYLSWFLDKAI